jgi:hypothetical protein
LIHETKLDLKARRAQLEDSNLVNANLKWTSLLLDTEIFYLFKMTHKLHKMLSLINASRKMSGSALPPEEGRPAKMSSLAIS